MNRLNQFLTEVMPTNARYLVYFAGALFVWNLLEIISFVGFDLHWWPHIWVSITGCAGNAMVAAFCIVVLLKTRKDGGTSFLLALCCVVNIGASIWYFY